VKEADVVEADFFLESFLLFPDLFSSFAVAVIISVDELLTLPPSSSLNARQ